MEKRIITISRQFGSGGHEVGMRLAKRLGVKFYDKELVDLLAKDGKYDVDFIEANEEKCSPPMCPIMPGFAMPVFYQDLPSDLIYKGQSKLIRSLAERGPCVVVGRCADYALAGRPGLLRIFCRADLSQRIKRIQQRHNLSPEKAALLVAKTDRHRRVYYHHHTGRFWGHSSCYDLTVNTSVLGVDKTAETLEAYIRAFREQD